MVKKIDTQINLFILLARYGITTPSRSTAVLRSVKLIAASAKLN